MCPVNGTKQNPAMGTMAGSEEKMPRFAYGFMSSKNFFTPSKKLDFLGE